MIKFGNIPGAFNPVKMKAVGNAIGSVVGGITGASQSADAAESASKTQASSAQAAIDEQKREYDSIVQMMSPYLNAGTSALTSQQNLLGLNGNDAQQSAINNIQNSSAYQTALKQGENSILQNASATGGLRGGNTQAALEQYSPTLLNQMVQQQYSNLGGLTSLGQSSAGLQANAGQSTANQVSSLLQQQGSAIAGGQIAQGNVVSSSLNSAAGLLGSFVGLGGISGIKKAF